MYFIHHFRFQGRLERGFLFSVLIGIVFQGPALSQEKAAPVAQCVDVEGVLLTQDKPGAWLPIAPQAQPPAERLLVALFGADLHSANGAVGIKLIGDVGERGVYPIMESAIRFHKNPAVDLDVTLERGIVIFSNRKKNGPVHIHARGRDKELEITLPDANSRLAVEIYGRHVPGSPNLADPKNDIPVTHVFFFALAGDPTIANDRQAVRLQAPPGTALLQWDSVSKRIETRFFDKLPELAKPRTPEENKKYQRICADVRVLAEKNATTGQQLDALLAAARDSEDRKAAVTAMGALGDLPRLVGALNHAKDAELRKDAILALRHWLGREPGQSIKLYEHLTGDLKYTSVQAKTLLQLLSGIDRAKLSQPGTYYLLIQFLNHSKLTVREMARWHLVRLVPDGRSIAYDAAAPEPQRMQAIAAWRKLIPEGELPPPPKSKTPAP